jgi:hypothetical protein
MKIKQDLKILVGNFFSPINEAIIVNSYGRSGSTMLTRSIVESIARKNTTLKQVLFKSIPQPAWDLDEVKIRPGFVYKTHDYPPKNSFNCNVRVIYIFADPVDVILSLLRLYKEKGEAWMREHYEHLKAPYTDFNNIIYEDQLRLENHFDAWLQEKRFPVAFIRYEELWNHQKEISAFLEVPIQLPSYKERNSKKFTEPTMVEKVKITYSSLREKVFNQKSFFVNKVSI